MSEKKHSISDLIDEAKCYEILREIKWSRGISCSECGSSNVRKNGHDKGVKHRQRYVCKDCNKSFTDISDTVISSNHVPIQKWMICFMLKDSMSNKQMASAINLPPKVVSEMRAAMSEGLLKTNLLDNWEW